MNLILVVPLMFVPVFGVSLALCNLMLCIFNLLPLPSSDGLRILRALSGTNQARSMIPVLSESGSAR
jgi:Zn-dependent protease